MSFNFNPRFSIEQDWFQIFLKIFQRHLENRRQKCFSILETLVLIKRNVLTQNGIVNRMLRSLCVITCLDFVVRRHCSCHTQSYCSRYLVKICTSQSGDCYLWFPWFRVFTRLFCFCKFHVINRHLKSVFSEKCSFVASFLYMYDVMQT